jgi:hypothetical protein
MLELMNVLESTKGWKPLNGDRPSDWDERIKETIDLINNKSKYPSHRHEFLVKEAMTTSDFPLLFGDILDRSLLAAYRSANPVMRQILQKGMRSDFGEGNVFDVQIGAGRLTEKKEKGEYHETNVGESRYHYALKEYGEKLLLSWRVLLKDNLGAFNRIPNWFSSMAINTEEYFLASLFFGAAGPLAAYFSVANGGAAVSALPLTINNLKVGISAMLKYRNQTSDAPIDNSPMYLMVGPGNEVNAYEITGTQSQTFSGGAAGIAYPVDSVIRKYNLKVVTNRTIPFLVTNGTIADTCWALFSDPARIAAGEYGQLTGHETPDIFIKKSDLQRLGGGDVSPLEGDFDSGTVGYLVRDVIGGCTLDGRAGWASNGQ